MLKDRFVRSRIAAIIVRAPAALVAPTPTEPSPPALATAAAMAGDEVPAIGAWMIGTSIFSKSSSAADCETAIIELPISAWRARLTVVRRTSPRGGAGNPAPAGHPSPSFPAQPLR